MDNIFFEKEYHEDNLIELKIVGTSKYVTANQSCYIQDTDLVEISNKILEFSKTKVLKCYIEFGNKQGEFTPAFSMELERINKHGHIRIEVDIEIDDNESRKHRCRFYIQSELGAVDKLGNALKEIVYDEIHSKVVLNS